MSTTTSTRRLPITAPFRAVKAFLEAKFRALAFNLSSATMTLSIEDGHARLLVLNKNRVVAWRSGEVAQPPEPDSGADLPSEAADANRPDARDFSPLGSLLEDLPNSSSLISRLFFWRPRRRVVADLPLHVPLLRHVPLPDVKGRYIKDIVNNEVLDSVPFAADEVDIQWQIAPGEGISEASVVAVPRDRMDELAGIVRGSNLVQSAVYPKAGALAAMRSSPNFEDAVVINVAAAGAGVGFTVDLIIPVPEPDEEEGETQAQSP